MAIHCALVHVNTCVKAHMLELNFGLALKQNTKHYNKMTETDVQTQNR